ncbi:MAG: hypothetical protein ACK4F4_11960 [Hylemonella sp.]|uniref:hypothetical protein n=1 Tax=Hylemonella sp. TaxID=2066020 RepID=UPI0039187D32
MKFNRLWAGALVVAFATLTGGAWMIGRGTPADVPGAPEVNAAAASVDPAVSAQVMSSLRELLADYRKIIVLLAEEDKLSAAEREPANQAGLSLFHDNLKRAANLVALFESGVASGPGIRQALLGSLLDYVESDPDLYDADRLPATAAWG